MVAAAVGAGASIIGGVMSSDAAGDAADTQASAARDAAAAQREAAAQAREDLMPYNNLGQGMINPLLQAMGYIQGPASQIESRDAIYQRLLPQYTSGGSSGGGLSSADQLRLKTLKSQYARLSNSSTESNANPFGRDLDAMKRQIDQLEGYGSSAGRVDYNALNAAVDAELQSQQQNAYSNLKIDPNNPLQQRFSFTGEDLENTPGYQFTLQQGLRAGNNSMTARGLGLSGAQIKGAEQFASGLASTTFNDQFNNALASFNTNYNSAANNANRLAGLVQMGQNSAAQTGSVGMTGAANAGNLSTQAANAQAAGMMGSANAITSGINGAANAYMTNNMLSSMYGGGSGNSGLNQYGMPNVYL